LYLSPTRNTAAARRFLGRALNGLKDWEKRSVINTDKAPTYAAAPAELKQEGRWPEETQHRQVKYLNNVIEADHGKLKQLIRPVRGFKMLKTAYATIKGFEVVRALRKGQASAFTSPVISAARPIAERAFGLGASALTEAVQFFNARLQVEAASQANPHINRRLRALNQTLQQSRKDRIALPDLGCALYDAALEPKEALGRA